MSGIHKNPVEEIELRYQRRGSEELRVEFEILSPFCKTSSRRVNSTTQHFLRIRKMVPISEEGYYGAETVAPAKSSQAQAVVTSFLQCESQVTSFPLDDKNV